MQFTCMVYGFHFDARKPNCNTLPYLIKRRQMICIELMNNPVCSRRVKTLCAVHIVMSCISLSWGSLLSSFMAYWRARTKERTKSIIWNLIRVVRREGNHPEFFIQRESWDRHERASFVTKFITAFSLPCMPEYKGGCWLGVYAEPQETIH